MDPSANYKRRRDAHISNTSINETAPIVSFVSERPFAECYSNCSSASRVVADLFSTLTSAKRLATLNHLLMKLDKFVASNDRNNPYILELLEAGIVNALILRINALLQQTHSAIDEIQLLCSSLDLVLQGTTEIHKNTVKTIQNEKEFFCLLTELLERIDCAEDTAFSRQGISNSIHHSIMSIAHTISSSAEGSYFLARQELFLEQVAKFLSHKQPDSCTNAQALYDSLGLLKNLTFFEEDTRQRVIRVDGMVTGLLSLSERLVLPYNRNIQKHDDPYTLFLAESKSQILRLSAIVRNFALSTECRSFILQFHGFLPALFALVMINDDNLLKERSFQPVLKNVLCTLISLAMHSKESSLLLLLHDESIILRHIKRLVKRGAETSLEVRKRTFRLLRLLLNDSTNSLLTYDGELFLMTTEAALHDVSEVVRAEASETFATFSSTIVALSDNGPGNGVPKEYNDALLDSLTALFSSVSHQRSLTSEATLSTLARSFKDLASRASMHSAILKRGDLITNAANIALLPLQEIDSSIVNVVALEDTCRGLMYLSKESNYELCRVPLVLDALVNSVSKCPIECTAGNHSTIRKKFALEALLNMASNESNLEIMANQPRLIQTLLEFASSESLRSVVDSNFVDASYHEFRTSKDELKKVIVHLVKQL